MVRKQVPSNSTGLDDQAATDGSADGRYYVQSLERGLAVIRAFDRNHPQQTVSDVARVAGVTRASARRSLLTLVDLGYVRTDGRLFTLRPGVLQLGYAYLSSLGLPELAEPHMKALVERVHDSCSLTVLDGADVVYVARIPTKRLMTLAISVGTRFPAYATSTGRVLLAGQSDDWLDGYLKQVDLEKLTSRTRLTVAKLRSELTTIRKQRYAIVDQELEEGVRSIAVPIHAADGSVVAALNVSLHVSRGTLASLRQTLLPALNVTAGDIETDLRGGDGVVRART